MNIKVQLSKETNSSTFNNFSKTRLHKQKRGYDVKLSRQLAYLLCQDVMGENNIQSFAVGLKTAQMYIKFSL